MAIQFDPNALRMFSGVNFGDDDAIANLGGENNLVQKDKLGSFFWKPFRRAACKHGRDDFNNPKSKGVKPWH